jgi:hypothetical protein
VPPWVPKFSTKTREQRIEVTEERFKASNPSSLRGIPEAVIGKLK